MSKYRNIDIQRFSEAFKALSNPNRLQIFLKLVSCCVPGKVYSHDQDEASTYVGDLGKDLEIAPSTVSHHIKELNRAGLISLKRRGQKIECWVDPEVMHDLKAFFSQ